MDDRTNPPPLRCLLVRASEVTRHQGQLLAKAYEQVCPEARRTPYEVGARAPAVHRNGRPSTAARAAAGA
jgi:hypothetical protein